MKLHGARLWIVLIAVFAGLYVLGKLIPKVPAGELPVTGVVRDAAGRAIGGATVCIVFHLNESPRRVTPWQPRAATDFEGRFSFLELPARDFFLVATHPEYCDSPAAAAPADRRSGLELRMTRGGTVHGRVHPFIGEIFNRTIEFRGRGGSRGWREVRSDKDGGFSISNVVPQDYEVLLRGDARMDYRYAVTRITVREGETTEVVLGAPH